MDLLQVVWGPINEVLLTVGPLLLNLLYALILLFIGLLIAKGLQWLVVTVLGALQLDKVLKDIGFTPFINKGGIKKNPSDLLGDLIYWLTIFVAVTAVANVLGLIPVKSLLGGLLTYLPGVLSAAYVLGVGVFVAVLLSAVVLVIANNIGLSNADILAKVVQYAIIIFAFLGALFQLGISPDWIGTSINLVVGGVILALALAFGLGAKDKAAEFIDKLFA